MARKQHYSQFLATELILRDQLAIDRTLLANERTLLSYLRSAVALVLAGLSMARFSNREWFTLLGLVCVPSGVATALFGAWRFRETNKAVSAVRRELDDNAAHEVLAADIKARAEQP
jgi:putative membrane protein